MPDEPKNAGVSFIVPVRDGERWLESCLTAIVDEGRSWGTFELIAVDDGSTDASPGILDRFARQHGVRVIRREGEGAAAALNRGLEAARFPIVCQVDQDVVIQDGWVQHVVGALLADDRAAAAQAEYRAAPDASIWARVTDLDLRLRWLRLHRGESSPVPVDHVCTGNTAYRRAALEAVGGFDESFGYGYDNELAYRLGGAGYRLLLCGGASAVHRWRQSPGGYLRQQYGQGYGRLDLVARHPFRFAGDDVSGLPMVLHAPGMLAALSAFLAAPLVSLAGGPGGWVALAGAALVGVLGVERLAAGLAAVRAFGDRAGFAFVPVHLLRDVAWAGAIVAWGWRRLTRRESRPDHSMGRSAVD